MCPCRQHRGQPDRRLHAAFRLGLVLCGPRRLHCRQWCVLAGGSRGPLSCISGLGIMQQQACFRPLPHPLAPGLAFSCRPDHLLLSSGGAAGHRLPASVGQRAGQRGTWDAAWPCTRAACLRHSQLENTAVLWRSQPRVPHPAPVPQMGQLTRLHCAAAPAGLRAADPPLRGVGRLRHVGRGAGLPGAPPGQHRARSRRPCARTRAGAAG